MLEFDPKPFLDFASAKNINPEFVLAYVEVLDKMMAKMRVRPNPLQHEALGKINLHDKAAIREIYMNEHIRRVRGA